MGSDWLVSCDCGFQFVCLLMEKDKRLMGAADLGMTEALLEEVTVNPTLELPELTEDWGNRLLEGTRTQEKEAVTPQETDPDFPVSVFNRGVGRRWPAARSWCLQGTF